MSIPPLYLSVYLYMYVCARVSVSVRTKYPKKLRYTTKLESLTRHVQRQSSGKLWPTELDYLVLLTFSLFTTTGVTTLFEIVARTKFK